jgi:hypothetical protein
MTTYNGIRYPALFTVTSPKKINYSALPKTANLSLKLLLIYDYQHKEK